MSTFLEFCRVLERVGAARISAQKSHIFADYLKSLDDVRDAELAVRFAGEGAVAESGSRVSAGHRMIAKTASDWLGVDYEMVFKPCREAAGNTGAAVERLMENLDEIGGKQQPKTWKLTEVQESIEIMAGEKSSHEKNLMLERYFREMSPLEVKIVLKILGSGALLTGQQETVILDAVALAYGYQSYTIRNARIATGSLSDTVLRAFNRDIPANPVSRRTETLNTVILYATAESGSGGGTYIDFTLGIRVSDDDRYVEDYIPIGKVSEICPDTGLEKFNEKIKNLVLERFGTTLLLKPEIVVETEYDEIQINRRTKAGYTLRFPRVKTIRWDKRPEEADTLKEVEVRVRGNVKC